MYRYLHDFVQLWFICFPRILLQFPLLAIRPNLLSPAFGFCALRIHFLAFSPIFLKYRENSRTLPFFRTLVCLKQNFR